MGKPLLFLIPAVFLIHSSYAQDKIIKMNGKEIDSVTTACVSDFLIYKKFNRPDSKEKHLQFGSVFSVIHPDGKEEYIYLKDTANSQRDTADEPNYSFEQVKMQIKGKQEALKYYHNNFTYFTGFVSAGVGIALAPITAGLIFIPPLGGSLLADISATNMKKQKISDPGLLNSQDFVLGYSEVASRKKLKKSLIGGAIGLSIGVPLLLIMAKK